MHNCCPQPIIHGDLKGVSTYKPSYHDLISKELTYGWISRIKDNILISKDGVAYISDFGLSRPYKYRYHGLTDKVDEIDLPSHPSSHATGGNFRWQAPELILVEGSKSLASDVYAFGRVMEEVSTTSRHPAEYSITKRYTDLYRRSPIWRIGFRLRRNNEGDKGCAHQA